MLRRFAKREVLDIGIRSLELSLLVPSSGQNGMAVRPEGSGKSFGIAGLFE